jgi:hypothetical protein
MVSVNATGNCAQLPSGTNLVGPEVLLEPSVVAAHVNVDRAQIYYRVQYPL